MSLSLTARYLHIASVYTYHAGRAARRVWDSHSMTPRTLQAALTAANAVIHLCVFTWWLLNESDWSKGIKHVRIAPMQAVTAQDLTPAIEEIEQLMTEAMPAPAADPQPETAAVAPSMSWTKSDLVSACRCYGLKPTGAKTVLLGRLLHQLA